MVVLSGIRIYDSYMREPSIRESYSYESHICESPTSHLPVTYQSPTNRLRLACESPVTCLGIRWCGTLQGRG
jgi:hypothetical protein